MRNILIVIIFFLAALGFAFFFLPGDRNSQEDQRVEQEPANLRVEKLQTEQAFTFARNVSDSLPAMQDVGGVTRYAQVHGRIKSARLFFRGFVEDNPLFAEWEDVYFNLGNGREQAGGHLINSYDEATLFEELSVDLSNAYLYRLGRQDFRVFDFLPIINAGRKLRLDFFISSARANRYIEEVTILYTCEGQCNISVVY